MTTIQRTTPQQRELLHEVWAYAQEGRHVAALQPHPLDDGRTLVVDVIGASEADRDREVARLAEYAHLGKPGLTADRACFCASGHGLLVRTAHQADQLHVPTVASIAARGGA